MASARITTTSRLHEPGANEGVKRTHIDCGDVTAPAEIEHASDSWESFSEADSDWDVDEARVRDLSGVCSLEDARMFRIAEIRHNLREHPLLPMRPDGPDEVFMDLNLGIRLPDVHCAVKGCTWSKDVEDRKHIHGIRQWSFEWELFMHLMSEHRDLFSKELLDWGIPAEATGVGSAMPYEQARSDRSFDGRWQCDLFLRIISDYLAAVRMVEEGSMPIIGVAKDRQVLRSLNAIMPWTTSKICFCCAQIHVQVPLWEKQYSPGQLGVHWDPEREQFWNENSPFAKKDCSPLRMYSVEESLQRLFFERNEVFRLHFSWEDFQARYCSEDAPDGNPFRNMDVLKQASADWLQQVHFEGSADVDLATILCCPEDVERCPQCTHQDSGVCARCRIPLCIECNPDSFPYW